MGTEQDVEVESPPVQQRVPVIAEEGQVREQDEQQDSRCRDGDREQRPGGRCDRGPPRRGALAAPPGQLGQRVPRGCRVAVQVERLALGRHSSGNAKLADPPLPRDTAWAMSQENIEIVRPRPLQMPSSHLIAA